MGAVHSLNMLAPQLLQFGSGDVLKIWRKRLTHLMNELMSNEGVCRTAPATPGLLDIALQN